MTKQLNPGFKPTVTVMRRFRLLICPPKDVITSGHYIARWVPEERYFFVRWNDIPVFKIRPDGTLIEQYKGLETGDTMRSLWALRLKILNNLRYRGYPIKQDKHEK